jgi:hypothetical protein
MPALIAVAAISAGSQIAAAKMQSNAAKNAAKTQSASADRAMAFQKQQYEQARQDFSPYQQTGATSLGRLGAMAGQQAPTFQPGQPASFASLGNPLGGGPQAVPPGPLPGQTTPPGAPPMPPQGPPQAQGQLVRVLAPTGEEAMLSPMAAQAAVAKGARILGAGMAPSRGMPMQGRMV